MPYQPPKTPEIAIFIGAYLHWRSLKMLLQLSTAHERTMGLDWHINDIDPQLFHSGTDKRAAIAPHKWNQGPYLTVLHEALWKMEATLQAV